MATSSRVDEFRPVSGSFRLHGWLLFIWFLASFGVVFFARDLTMIVASWPVGYWFAAQGSVFVFIGIVALFAWCANRREHEAESVDLAYSAYKRRLHRKLTAHAWHIP